ncbi:MAG: hypothetical protein LC646_12385 [Xanthomonadaceae bacterium]|nr:hypothetical protein [Xanthomonadaceae bacterium]
MEEYFKMVLLRFVKYGYFVLALLLSIGVQASPVYPNAPNALLENPVDLDEIWFGPDSHSRWTTTSNTGPFSLFTSNSSAVMPSMTLVARSVPRTTILFPEKPHAQFSLPGWRVTDWERNGSHLSTWESITGGEPRDYYDLVILVKPVHFTGIPASQEVPVPAALWLLGSGLLALFGLARRRS